MPLEKRYVMMAPELDDGDAPLAALEQVSSSLHPSYSGSAALATKPFPGLLRAVDIQRVLSSGIVVLKLTPDEASAFRYNFPHLQLAPESFVRHADQDLAGTVFPGPDVGADGWPVVFEVRNAAQDLLSGVHVVQKVPGLGLPFGAPTDDTGRVQMNVIRSDAVFEVHPPHSYWSAYVGTLDRDGSHFHSVVLESLPSGGGHRWDLREMGLDGSPVQAALRVGIVDTGVAKHFDLPKTIRGKNFVAAEGDASWQADYHRHGTAIAGIIAGLGYTGYAPQAELTVYKAFPRVGSASTIDLAVAITEAADDGVDVLCLAFCSDAPDIAITRSLEYAGTKGVLVVAAAGNDARDVGWPAACGLPNVISVGAFGRLDAIPANTIFENSISDYQDTGFFHAAFSNRQIQGPGCIDLIAPGVGCISAAPGGYAAAQGTSLAAAHVSGVLAFALMRRPDLLIGVPKGPERADKIRQWLLRSCRTFDWGFDREGHGRPNLQRMLSITELT